MMQNKYLFGITGGSGSGKSTVSDIFRSLGCEIIDCDIIAREVTQKGTPCLDELAAEFGEGIISPEGELLRKKLGEIVFSNAQKLSRLNEITHRHILAEIFRRVDASDKKLVGIDGAVLFESGVTNRCSTVIGVLANRDLRLARIMERDGMTRENAENRINSQRKDNFYLEKCPIILYNNGNRQDLEDKVREVVLKLEKEAEIQKTE